MNEPRTVAAITAWREAIGVANVETGAQALNEAQSATFATTHAIPAILRPGSVAEVQACLRIANEYRTPVYPISTGRNWGLGSRVPARDGCVLLELSRLNQIRDFDEKLAYVTVEPGVTFQQLHAFLRDRQSKLFSSVIGGSPLGSVLANAIERGDGEGPLGDRAAHVAGLEAVLPNGELLRTGFSRFDNNRAAHTNRWGVGPALDGLFMQSNLGVVTSLTIWLSPKPAYRLGFTCKLADTANLAQFIDALQPLVLQGVIAGNCFTLWNSNKFLAREGSYPWGIMQGKTPFSLRERKGVEPWFGAGSVYCASPAAAAAARAVIEPALAGCVAGISFFGREDLPENMRAMFEPGTPSDTNIRTTYWRKRGEIPADMNPDRDRCGVIWLCPVLPFDGSCLAEAAGIINALALAHGFEAHIGLNPTSGRNLNLYITLAYDRDVAGEDARAMACHDAMLAALAAQGLLPYRLGIQSMQSLPPGQPAYAELLRTLKATLDPNDILAPGHYDFRNHR
jgi:4-cresol dehydrogenase (hydroxylating)